MVDGKKHVGIGFATGRASFQNVLRAYIFHLQESHFLIDNDIVLSLFVAFDPSYTSTCREDYDNLTDEERSVFYKCHFIGPEDIRAQLDEFVKRGVIEPHESEYCFGNGYAVQRNIVQYTALCEEVDYLLFLDDDEYPLAVTESHTCCLWSGQLVLEEHIKYLQFADFTNGHHCGYLSPMPLMEFDGILSEQKLRSFTEALSSDVLRWEDLKRLRLTQGVTFAEKEILIKREASLVPTVNGAKYISGGNLGINLTQPERVLPFYNPPGARGEDSILGTCLAEYTVKSIPVYTFHDGFGFYGSLLRGVLPISLRGVSMYDSAEVAGRFYRACIGWMRYKPLYTYLTQPDEYQRIMDEARQKLGETLPSVCAYFNNRDFMSIGDALETYSDKLQEHYDGLQKAKEIWRKIIDRTVLGA